MSHDLMINYDACPTSSGIKATLEFHCALQALQAGWLKRLCATGQMMVVKVLLPN